MLVSCLTKTRVWYFECYPISALLLSLHKCDWHSPLSSATPPSASSVSSHSNSGPLLSVGTLHSIPTSAVSPRCALLCVNVPNSLPLLPAASWFSLTISVLLLDFVRLVWHLPVLCTVHIWQLRDHQFFPKYRWHCTSLPKTPHSLETQRCATPRKPILNSSIFVHLINLACAQLFRMTTKTLSIFLNPLRIPPTTTSVS